MVYQKCLPGRLKWSVRRQERSGWRYGLGSIDYRGVANSGNEQGFSLKEVGEDRQTLGVERSLRRDPNS